jgi:tetratricopeptide (TPR) repeat protein
MVGAWLASLPGMKTTMLAVAVVLATAGTSSGQSVPSIGSYDPAGRDADRYASAAASALARRQWDDALGLADLGLARHPGNAWLLYNRGAALANLERIDEAHATLAQAEDAFGPDEHGRSLAIWRDALMMEQAGRCDQARARFREYAQLVRQRDADSAEQAETHAQRCITPGERENVGGRAPDGAPRH